MSSPEIPTEVAISKAKIRKYKRAEQKPLGKKETTPFADREENWLREQTMKESEVESFVRPFITRIDEFLAASPRTNTQEDGTSSFTIVVGEEEVDIMAREQKHMLGPVSIRKIEILKESETSVDEHGEPTMEKHVIEVSLKSMNMTFDRSGSYFRYQLFEEGEESSEERGSVLASSDYRNSMEGVNAIEEQLAYITELLPKEIEIFVAQPEPVHRSFPDKAPDISLN
jgi:hypothetical protein